LFYDPQAGFDAIRDRLGSFDRDTLVAIMSSREDISEADANRIIDQIEGARNNVLNGQNASSRKRNDAWKKLSGKPATSRRNPQSSSISCLVAV